MIVCVVLSQLLTLMISEVFAKNCAIFVLLYESKCDFVTLHVHHDEVSWRRKYCHLKVGVRRRIIKWFQCTKCV